MSGTIAHRVLGGSPIGVLARLLVVSLLVGALMSWLEIDPALLFDWLQQSLMRLWFTGFRSLHEVGRYILTGAAVVIPVWIVLRLTSIGSRTPGPPRPSRWDLPGSSPEDPAASPLRTGRRD